MINMWTNAVHSSALWRFISVGVGDALRGLAGATAREAPDDARVVDVIESSEALGFVARVLAHFETAAATSVVVPAWTAQRTAWHDQSVVERARNTGVALLTAAAVYVGLSVWRRPAAGWLWLVAPVLATAFGALLVLAPGRTSRSDGRS